MDGDVWTLRRIASRYGRELHQVRYVIEALGVRPVARAGAARIFAPEDVDRIGRCLEDIDVRRKAAQR